MSREGERLTWEKRALELTMPPYANFTETQGFNRSTGSLTDGRRGHPEE